MGDAPTPPDVPLEVELRTLLNRHSADNRSNTPDYLLAEFLIGCLDAFNFAVIQRETWYGRPAPASG